MLAGLQSFFLNIFDPMFSSYYPISCSFWKCCPLSLRLLSSALQLGLYSPDHGAIPSLHPQGLWPPEHLSPVLLPGTTLLEPLPLGSVTRTSPAFFFLHFLIPSVRVAPLLAAAQGGLGVLAVAGRGLSLWPWRLLVGLGSGTQWLPDISIWPMVTGQRVRDYCGPGSIPSPSRGLFT